MRPLQTGAADRHGLTREDARALTEKILGFASADHTRVNVWAGVQSNTRTAINRITTAGASDNTTVTVTSVFGKRQASITTNRLDDAALEAAVARSEALARIAPENPEYLPELGEQDYLDVDGSYASTGGLTTEARAEAAALAVAAAEESETVAAGFISVAAGSTSVATSNGAFGYYMRTGVNSTLTVRTPDGSSSGWAGDEASDWNTIESERIAADAVRKCLDWRGRTDLEPGLYDVVLEPTAVGNLLLRLMWALDARAADEGRSFFSKPGGGNRIGERLFDERITLASDPSVPDAEASPFTNDGQPTTRNLWVENGVLRSLRYSRFWADRSGTAPNPGADNFLMSGGDATLDDLIAATERGVLITRLWYIRELNPRTIAYTGLTRDGTFLIENGRIARPVTNFRFNQSIPEMLQNVDLVGRAARVASGEGDYGPPVVVPPLKVRGFNLASVSDAI